MKPTIYITNKYTGPKLNETQMSRRQNMRGYEWRAKLIRNIADWAQVDLSICHAQVHMEEFNCQIEQTKRMAENGRGG